MKLITSIVSIVLLATVASAQETARPIEVYASAGPAFGFFGDDFKDVAGVSAAVGLRLPNQHSVEFEASYFASEERHWSSVDMKFIPLLGKYRVPVPVNDKIAFSVAGVAGGMYEKLGGGYYHRKDGAFAAGGEAAVHMLVSKRVDISAGVTALYLTETDITTSGTIALVNLRATYRF